jgi:hypothetical protein
MSVMFQIEQPKYLIWASYSYVFLNHHFKQMHVLFIWIIETLFYKLIDLCYIIIDLFEILRFSHI